MLAVCLMLLKFFVGYFHHGDSVTGGVGLYFHLTAAAEGGGNRNNLG